VKDNLNFHKEVGVQVVYLSAYSADLHPIENAFAKLKSLHKTKLRTMDGL